MHNVIEWAFAIKGRSNRAPFWKISLAVWGAVLLLSILTSVVVSNNYQLGWRLGLLWMITLPPITIPGSIRRLHDRNKSGWWIIPLAILPYTVALLSIIMSEATNDSPEPFGPVIYWGIEALMLWGFIEIGCLRGTIGTNRFGSDPLVSPGQLAEPFS